MKAGGWALGGAVALRRRGRGPRGSLCPTCRVRTQNCTRPCPRTSRPPGLKGAKRLLFKLPDLWCFVATAR